MLSQEDNDLLCRVGPGTPMGNLFRQYWLPAIRSDELPGPDAPPVRIMLLGEKLIGFRMTSGKVGLVADACPHRGASMFFGRNEEEGLRCVYHGWKFDGSGTCVDMPSEPAESNFKNKVRIGAYQTQERNGIVWAYMGPREIPPPLPDIEANILNKDPEGISVLYRPNNWMQGLEGEMDTVHFVFLHMGAEKADDQAPGSFNSYQYKQRAGKFVVRETDFGCSYGLYRPAEDDTNYWRIGHSFFPFYAEQAAGDLGPVAKMNAYVPMDDEHTLQWEINVRTDDNSNGQSRYKAPINRGEMPDVAQKLPPLTRGVYVPQTSDWYGRFRLTQDMDNDYLIDREDQKSNVSYTGIPGIRQQDMAMTETMGPIYARDHEHLGTTDSMIIRTRRRWIAAAKALRDHGAVPPGVDDPTVYRQRSGECILPRSEDWWDGSRHLREVWTAGEVAQPQEAPVSGS
ncbi:MAG TPA: Rieske 2Fe-2S domain-containing protein [Dehalococcoidia bacterium]|nr:Rieske 2Fe-2S domain-containing protein [Dehalococcoidia bacterium]